MTVKKYISSMASVLEVGDFYGGGDDEVIQSMEAQDTNLRINTNMSYYDLTLKAGDYIAYEDGSSKIFKSKFDIQDE